MKEKIIKFIKKETILCVSLLLAIISMFFVAPDKKYVDYVDFRTLMLLFCLMAVMAGFQSIGLFKYIGSWLLSKTKNTRQLVLILIMLPFILGMFITNDVALITFVPFALIVLRLAQKENLIVIVVILQTIAANLGSMLMPMGNPQNLYLYSKSKMSLGAFVTLMLPYTIISAILLILSVLFIKREKFMDFKLEEVQIKKISLIFVYSILFTLCLLTVSKVISVYILLGIIAVAFICIDRSIFKKIDYSLLGTFIGFFVFIGNMGRLPSFCNFLEKIIAGHETIVSVLASQLISNVPAALLLSGFTDNFSKLIIGTNLGGLGTLIASMASLISYKQIAREYPDDRVKYIGLFSIFNVAMLIILFTASSLIG